MMLLYSLISSLGDRQASSRFNPRFLWAEALQFLYIDLFTIIPVAVTSTPSHLFLACRIANGGHLVGRTLPFPMLHIKRPTASLVSMKVLTSIIGQIVIASFVQIWAFKWVRSQPW